MKMTSTASSIIAAYLVEDATAGQNAQRRVHYAGGYSSRQRRLNVHFGVRDDNVKNGKYDYHEDKRYYLAEGEEYRAERLYVENFAHYRVARKRGGDSKRGEQEHGPDYERRDVIAQPPGDTPPFTDLPDYVHRIFYFGDH
jgi:hypothetical protein